MREFLALVGVGLMSTLDRNVARLQEVTTVLHQCYLPRVHQKSPTIDLHRNAE